MENKSLLFLLVGLGMLTLVVLVSLVFFYPQESIIAEKEKPQWENSSEPSSTTSLHSPSEFDPVEWTRNLPSMDFIPLSSDTKKESKSKDLTITVNPPLEEPEKTASPSLPSSPSLTEAPASNSSIAYPRKNVSKPVQRSKSPQVQKKDSPKSPKIKPKNSTPFTPATKAAQEKNKPQRKVKEYWIQVGAYKDRYQADNVVKSLELQGFQSVLFTTQSGKQNIIRIRLGPYSNHDEARKFLSWIKPLKGFEESFIAEMLSPRG